MQHFKAVVEKARMGNVWQKAVGSGKPVWSFDNDRIHCNPFILNGLQINSKNRYPLPPNSPDMHRVVERCIGRLKKAFQTWLHDHPAKRTMREYRAALLKIFKEKELAESINKEVKSLVKLFPHISKAKGGWPPKNQL